MSVKYSYTIRNGFRLTIWVHLAGLEAGQGEGGVACNSNLSVTAWSFSDALQIIIHLIHDHDLPETGPGTEIGTEPETEAKTEGTRSNKARLAKAGSATGIARVCVSSSMIAARWKMR